MAGLLSLLLRLFGLVVVCIGCSIILFGPEAVASFFVALIALIVDVRPPYVWGIDGDNEMRFYSIFFVAYGVFVFMAGDLNSKYAGHIPLLSALFFIGGASRLISVWQNGWPHPLFTGLMIIELVLPLFFIMLDRARGGQT